MEFVENDGVWIAKVNADYLRGVVTVFEAADNIPYAPEKIPLWETRDFGFIIGVVVTVLISLSIR